MKLTPEQKAFYEYGKARTDLNCKIKEIRNNARIRFRMEYCELPLSPRAEILNLFGFEGFIDKVRQKRAACRAWKLLAQRHCLNCLYRENPANAAPCADCTLGDLTEDSWLVCNWKPRKEASND